MLWRTPQNFTNALLRAYGPNPFTPGSPASAKFEQRRENVADAYARQILWTLRFKYYLRHAWKFSFWRAYANAKKLQMKYLEKGNRAFWRAYTNVKELQKKFPWN